MKKKKLLKILLITIAIPVILIGSLTMYAIVAKGATFDDFLLAMSVLGSCATGQECMNYCEQFEHTQSCLDLAIKYFPGIYEEALTPNERAEIQKFFQAIKSGVKLPGNSSNRKEYYIYCGNPVHTTECEAFEKEYPGVMRD